MIAATLPPAGSPAPALLFWLHASSDVLVAVGCASIGLSLYRILRRRTDVPYNWVIVLFISFMLSCTAWRAIDAIALFYPLERLEEIVNALTAIAAIATSIAVAPSLPRLMSPIVDSLTRLPNRVVLRDRLERALSRARRRPGGCVALLFVDLDGFKRVNDTLGHARGDDLLVGVARRLKRVVRDVDTVSRFGGDEFVVLLDGIEDVTFAKNVARRILVILEEPFRLGAREVSISASIGIVVSNGKANAAELTREADRAMYRAKQRSSGTYEISLQDITEKQLA